MTKIMLVEDDKSLREIYGVRLLAEGYDIISAGDGEEALAMAIKDRPQLIISDVMMPKISGFDMLDILRSTTETKNIRVIMMTALSSDEQRQRGEQLGADKYLVKSQVGIEDVVKAVHEVLGDTPSAANAPAPVTPQPTPAPSLTNPPPAPGSTNIAQTPTSADEASTTIPEPTAPFTGQRPATLGDRVIQPLADNPRISRTDVSELMDKELANTIQSVENTAPSVEENTPATSSTPPAPVAAPSTVSMTPPAPAMPAPDEPITASAPTAAPSSEPNPVVANPLLQYEESPLPQATSPSPAPAAPSQPTSPTQPVTSPADPQGVAIPDRAEVPLTAPEREMPPVNTSSTL